MNKKGLSAQMLVIVIAAVAALGAVFMVGMGAIQKTDEIGEGFSKAHNNQERLVAERSIFNFEKCLEKNECANFNKDISGILKRQPYNKDTKEGAIIIKNPGPFIVVLDEVPRAEMTVELCVSDEDGKNQVALTELYFDKTYFWVNGQRQKLKNEATGDIFEIEGEKLCLRRSATP